MLFDGGNNNDHQVYAIGVDPTMFRSQIDSTVARFGWFAGTSSATSNELMRLQGDGKLALGNTAPDYLFEAGTSNPAGGVIARFSNTSNGGATGATGAYIQIHQGGVTQWRIGVPAGVSALAFHAYGNVTYPEVMRLTETLRLLLGTTTDNGRDLMQVNGSISGKVYKQGANPSAGEVPVDAFRLVKNTSNGEVRLWVNDGGTMKSTLLS